MTKFVDLAYFIFRNLYRSYCAEVHPCRSSIIRVERLWVGWISRIWNPKFSLLTWRFSSEKLWPLVFTFGSVLDWLGALILTTMPTSETFLDVISLDHMWAASESETGTAPGGGTRDRMEFESITISKPIKNQYFQKDFILKSSRKAVCSRK